MSEENHYATQCQNSTDHSLSNTYLEILKNYVKVKQPLYRLGQALKVAGG
jgi:uridine kinase